MAAQVEELERVGQLRRFLPPQIAELIVDSGDESFLESHRREITVVSCDLRGFTTFAETTEPEEVWKVLGEYHAAMGDLVTRFEGTLEHFAGDGFMVFFNDPVPCDDPADRAVKMAVAMRSRAEDLSKEWARRDQDLRLSIGIAQGYATLGRIGFEGRFDYAAIGTVCNLAARLCADAEPWQILVTQRVQSETEHLVVSDPVGELELRGISKPVAAHAIRGRTRRWPDDDLARRSPHPPALDDDARNARYDELQARLPDVWRIMRLNVEDESVVIIPSVTVDRVGERSGTLVQAYEERFLFLLLLLRQPRMRLIYVTSMPVSPLIVEYYLALLPGIIPSHARARLHFVSVNDASPRSSAPSCSIGRPC